MPHYKNIGSSTSTSISGGKNQSFDDPNISYNENCLFYDGGYDLKCLAAQGLIRRQTSGGPYPKTKIYPQVDVINLIFQTCIEYVNDKVYTEENNACEIKKYQFPKDTSNVTIKTIGMNVKRRLFKITSDEFNVNTISRFLDKDNNPTSSSSIVSSSLTKLSTHVSSSLHFNKPNKIVINSSIIKNDIDKNKENN